MERDEGLRDEGLNDIQLTLFPEPPLAVEMPNEGSLEYKCLMLLLDGRNLNHPFFDNETGSWRLAAVIHKLKKMGWDIAHYDVDAPTENSPGRHIRYYLLPQRVINAYNSIRDYKL